MASVTAGNVRRLRVPRRTPRACQQCRAGKVRCSGDVPCTRCVRRKETCIFPSDEPHVSVPESYLLQLEQQVAAASTLQNISSSPSVKASQIHPTDIAFASNHPTNSTAGSAPPSRGGQSDATLPSPHKPFEEGQKPILTGPWTPHNPLIETNFLRDTAGRYRFLGPTSTWAFVRRLLSLLEPTGGHHLGSEHQPLNLDGAAFHLRWAARPAVERSDLNGLPPLNYAMYLYNTVKYQLGDLFHIVDEGSFSRNLTLFHQDPWTMVQTHRLWFVEYLLFLAFGKAFLGQPDGTNSPHGHEFASRALSLLPGPYELHEEQLHAIEVLALIALYFQSIDMRIIAYQYIGQAVRLCGVEGIHHDLPEALVGREISKRANLLWWNVYNLDRNFSALMGCSNSISDEQVSAEMPSVKDSSLHATALTLEIGLSRLIAKTCTTVYHVSGQGLGGDFVKNTTQVLHSLAEISQELEAAMPNFSKDTPNDFPQVFSHVTLSYHHCIVLATRPLVMWLLLLALPPATTEIQQLASPIASLLQTSAESALSILAVLHKYATNDLLGAETFLPFHLEFAFSSALLLSVLGAILPEYVPDRAWQRLVHSVLQSMMTRGNVAVRLRIEELERLEELLGPYRRPQNGQAGPMSIPQPGSGVDANGIILSHTDLAGGATQQPLESGLDNFTPSSWDVLFSAWPPTNNDQLLELADELDLGDFNSQFFQH